MRISKIDRKLFIVNILLFLFNLSFNQITTVSAADYPMEVKRIEKINALYDTPENAYIALISAMLSEDIEWYYNGLTKQSATNEIELYKKNNINIQEKFDSVKNVKRILILDKKIYKDGVALIIEMQELDGSLYQGPSMFIQEEGLWKSMQEISVDDPILEYLYYIPPFLTGKARNLTMLIPFLVTNNRPRFKQK